MAAKQNQEKSDKDEEKNSDILFRLARTDEAMADTVIKLLEVRRKRREVKAMMRKCNSSSSQGSTMEATLPNGLCTPPTVKE